MNRPAPDPAFRPVCRRLAFGALLFLGPRIGHAAPNPADAAETPRPIPVARELSALLSRPEFARATWGVSVFDLATGHSLFATNEHRLLKPASTAKLFTAALALDAFGPDHRLRTELVPTGPLDRHGTLHGDLVVRGHGDFSCSARFHAGQPDRAMEAIVEALSRAGVRRIQGALVADVAAFPTPTFGNGWTADDLQYSYGAPVGALNADDNALELVLHPGTRPGDPLRLVATPPTAQLTFDLARTSTVATNGPRALEFQREPGSTRVRLRGTLPLGGAPWTESMAIPDPARHFVERATRALNQGGIKVREPAALSGISAAPELTRHPLPALTIESPPLSELIAGALKPSQNQYSQLLLLQVGQREEP